MTNEKKNLFYLLGILILFSFTFVSSAQINNVTLQTSSSNYQLFVNYSDTEQVIITSTDITLIKSLANSLFTNTGSVIAKLTIRNLDSPINDILFGATNNLILNTINSDVLFSNGEKVLIYDNVEGSSNTQGGTSTNYVPIYLNNVSIDNANFIIGQENTLYIYVRDIKNNLVDPESIELNILLLDSSSYQKELVRLRQGIFKVKINILDEDVKEIKVEAIAKEKGKTINLEKTITLAEKTTQEEIKQGLNESRIKLINLLSDKTIQWILWSLVIFVFAFVIIRTYMKRKRK